VLRWDREGGDKGCNALAGLVGNRCGAFGDGGGSALCSFCVGLVLFLTFPLNVPLNLYDCLTVSVGRLAGDKGGAESGLRFFEPA
jgi:hypothetical protein